MFRSVALESTALLATVYLMSVTRLTGSEVSASVRLLAARPLLQASVKCRVANQAMNNSAMTASVTLDINLRPLATRSAATHYYLT